MDNQFSTVLNESLGKISKGAAFAFIGLISAAGSMLLARLLIVRIDTETEYGIFSLAFAILNVCAILGTLGMELGIPRSIGFAKGKKITDVIQVYISSSIQFSLLAGVLLGIALFFLSDILASNVFNADLGYPLKIVAVGIPFLVLIKVIGAIFRGFDNVKPGIYFSSILMHVLFLLFLLPLLFITTSFDTVFYALLASIVISGMAFTIYATGKLSTYIKPSIANFMNPAARELLLFSIPLFGVMAMHQLIIWTDTLMLGVFKTSAEVGLYNAAVPLARFISMPLLAIGAIYLPVISRLYGQNSVLEIRKSFAMVTKWLCTATFPFFLILFLFPDIILSVLFGTTYAQAENTLRIVAFSFIVNNFMGPNGTGLIAMGQSRLMLWSTLATLIINITLNMALIPPLGIEGAAIASVVSFTFINILRTWKFYSLTGAIPISRNLLKPVVICIAFSLLLRFTFGEFIVIAWWMLPLILVLLYGIYGLAMLFTRCFEENEITMFRTIKSRIIRRN